MAKRTRRRKQAAERQPAQAVSLSSADTGDAAAQLADAQRRVVQLTRELKTKAAAGSRARKLMDQLQDEGTSSAAAAVALAQMKPETLPLKLLKQLAYDEPTSATNLVEEQTKKAQEVVDFYSLVASGVGLLPGLGVSFAGVFATQVLMVRDIAAAFGRDLTTAKTTTAVSALLGTAFGVGIGNGLSALTYSAFPTGVGNFLGILANPVASYATSQAIGSVFISQFQNENRQEITKGLAAQVQQVRDFTAA